MMARLDESRLSEISGPAPIKRATPYDPRSGNTPDSISPKKAFIDPTFTEGMVAAGDAYAAAGDAAAAEADALLAESRVVKKPVVTDPVADLLAKQEAARIADADRRDRQSAYDILYNQFNQYGLGTLVEDIKYLIQSNVSPSQFSLELQNTKAYQNRFAANKERIAKGLSALSPAEYIGLEDQYQNVMRNYGLPASYYTKDATGKQAGFEKFLAGDVSASELEDRIGTAQKRVINANPVSYYST
jgi:hypothetical protein